MTSAATPSRVARPRNRWLQTAGVWLGSLAVIAATAGVLGVLAWRKYVEIQAGMNQPPPPEMPTTVGIRAVETVDYRNSTSSVGTILAPRSITVNNEMPGLVTEVLFQPGQIVEEKTKLLQLDDSVEKTQLKAASVREKFANSTYNRNQRLTKGDAVSPSELEEMESAWRQAQAQVEELTALIERKEIIAPFRGRVGLTDVHKGQYLAAGSKITTLQSIEEFILVEFTLAQNVVSQIKVDDPVQVMNGDQKLTAKISAIDAQADRQTRNVRVRARIDNPPDSLSPGDSVSVLTEYGAQMTLPAVPAESVRRSPQGTFVFIAEKNAKEELRASTRPVVLATSVGSMVGIARGVSVGENLIVEGSFKLQDGALIVAGSDTPETGGN